MTHISREVRSQFQESVLSFHLMGSRDLTQVLRLSSKHLCTLNHLTDPELATLKKSICKPQVQELKHFETLALGSGLPFACACALACGFLSAHQKSARAQRSCCLEKVGAVCI